MSAISLRSAMFQQGAEHIYYNLNIINNQKDVNAPPPVLRFEETRNNPYLLNPSEYYCSVVRFQMDTPSLPLFIPIIETGQANPDKTIYTITLSYDYLGTTYDAQESIIFESENLNEPAPSPPLTSQDISTQYYYLGSFFHWITLVNKTFETAYNNLNAQITGAGGALPSANIPFMEWDPITATAILDADELGYNDALANPIKIFFNNPMFNLFCSFDFDFLGYNQPAGKNYRLNVYNVNNTNRLLLPTYTALQMYQEYSTAPLWCPISSIVFTTSLLPITPSLVSVPKTFGSNSSLISSGNNSAINSILTDFEVALTKGTEYLPQINYTPAGEYRLIDLIGNNPLSSIELTVYWMDKFNNLHPFYLNSGCSANLKLMFRKKSFNGL